MNSVRTGRGSNLEAAAVLIAIITIGFSQIIYNLVSVKPVAFSPGFRFIFWTLLWILIFPFFILISVDYFLRCRVSNAIPFQVWRTTLYGMFAISLLRQFQVFHADTAKYFLGSTEASWIYPVFFLIALALIWRTRKFIDRYLAFLGAFSLVLPSKRISP